MPPKRPNRFKYASVTDRSHRSLQECLEYKSERRKTSYSYKNWITVVMFIIALHYTYTYFWLSDGFEVSSNVLTYRGDELLTTKRHDKSGTGTPSLEVTADHPLRTTQEMGPLLRSDITYKVIRNKTKNLPTCIRKKYIGNYKLNTSKLYAPLLDVVYPMVQNGGYYKPPNCSAKHKVAVIVPYRGRQENLGTFLYNIHPFLMKQKLEYQIFVVEQSGNDLFNKGRLFNVGFKEIHKLNKFKCMVFHDVDLLPTNFEILYSCPTLPRHMCAAINDTEFRNTGVSYKFNSLFGGVVSLTVEMFLRANGYSNLYFGWGGEDNDLFWRLRATGYPVVRYNKSVGIYLVLPHTRAPVNNFRSHLLVRALERYKVDGLFNLEYIVESKQLRPLYTHIVANVNPRNENITALTARWAAGDNTY